MWMRSQAGDMSRGRTTGVVLIAQIRDKRRQPQSRFGSVATEGVPGIRCAGMLNPWRRLRGHLAVSWPATRSFIARHRRWIVLIAALVLCEAGYTFLVSAGTWSRLPPTEARIDELAEAFRAGHLHLLREPHPALLSAANPFDPKNANLWYWDASLYRGHFYYYWGPVPALLLASAKIVLRISRTVADNVVLLGLVTLQLVFGALLIDRLARRLFPTLPAVAVGALVLVFGFATPTPFMLARPAIYEAAIVGGEAFLLLGLLMTFEAVWDVDRPSRSNVYGLCAGLAFGLAVGCRLPLAPGITVLCAAAAAVGARRSPERRWHRFAEMLVAHGIPLAAIGGLLLLYNRLRFDHWFEFGQRFQMTWIPWTWSPRFIPGNLYSYALRAGALACRFPFVRALTDMGAAAFPNGFHLPEGYFVYEPLIGLLRIAPWIWLCPAAFASRSRAPGAQLDPDRRRLAVLILIAGTLPMAAVLCAPSATMRYLGDVSPALMVLACLGACNLQRLVSEDLASLWAARSVLSLLAGVTIGAGFLLGTTGYYNNFEANNPALSARLDRALSVCRPH